MDLVPGIRSGKIIVSHMCPSPVVTLRWTILLYSELYTVCSLQSSSACVGDEGAEEKSSGSSSSDQDEEERGQEGRREGATAAAVATRKAG